MNKEITIRNMKSHKVDKSNVQVPEVKSWPEEGLEYVGGCPVCGTTDRRLMYEGLTDRVFFLCSGRMVIIPI